MNASKTITVDPEIQGGTPCFSGTRVPVKSLFDALDHGRSTEYFIAQFPSVSEEQVRDTLRHAKQLVEANATDTQAK